MEFSISKLAISKPTAIYILLILVAIIGFASYISMPREDMPDVSINHLYLTITYPGASSMEIESKITNKVEEELQDLDNVIEMISTTENERAVFDLEYKYGTDLELAKNDLRDALEAVKSDLPDDGNEWVINEFNASDRPIMTVNVSGNIGLFELTEIAEDVETKFKKISGISEIDRFGGLEKEVKVQVNPQKLQYYSISLNQISKAISYGNQDTPGGSLEIGPMKYQIRILGEAQNVSEIGDMVVTMTRNGPVYVKDLARVEFGYKDIESRSRLNGLESVSLDIKKMTGADLGAISDKVRHIVKKEQEKYGENVYFNIPLDESIDIDNGVRSLENAIISGIIFVFIVLIIALGVRNAFFVGMAIPLSMLISFGILSFLGITINKIVLFSLIVALGMLVDNAIVIVENIYRHINTGKSRKEATIIGVNEVAAPVIASTITTLLAFIPIIFMPNIIGKVFSYLPLTLLVTLTSSLVVGLVFNPVLCSTMMPIPKKIESDDEMEIARRSPLLNKYRKILEFVLRHPIIILMMIGVFWFGSIFCYFRFSNPAVKTEFFPKMQPYSAVITISAPDGSTVEAVNSIVKEVEARVQPFSRHANSIVSNISTPDSTVTLNFPSWQEWKELKPLEIIDELQKIIPEFSGAQFKIEGSGGGPPVGNDVQIEILGKDLNLLRETSKQIETLLRPIEGLVNLDNEFISNRTEIQVAIDREKVANHGLSHLDVASVINTAFQGSDISEYRIGLDNYDIRLQLDKQYRQSIADLKSLFVLSSTGEQVPLSEIAEIVNKPAAGTLKHIDLDRVAIITAASSKDRSGAEVLKDAQKAIATILPEIEAKGMVVRYGGAHELQTESQGYLIQSFIIAVCLIFMVLVVQFNSLILPFIILTTVVASFAGVFIGFSAHSMPLSVMMGGIGIVALAGIVVNNAIVLVDYIGKLRKRGFELNEAIILAGMSRLRPVLLTAITTMLGMLPITIGMEINFYQWPIVFFGSESGALWRPLNVAVLYGIGIATFLTLFMVPTLYYLSEVLKQKTKILFTRQRSTLNH